MAQYQDDNFSKAYTTALYRTKVRSEAERTSLEAMLIFKFGAIDPEHKKSAAIAAPPFQPYLG